MARSTVEVTYGDVDAARLPDGLVEAATVLMELSQRGMVDVVGQRLQIRRQGGYCGLDVWLVLLVYFTMGAGLGFRGFWEVARRHSRQLAALARRRSLPSPASVSRALDAVEFTDVRSVGPWLLVGPSEIAPVLAHPTVQTYDARGEGWHVFDLDPTVTTLRHRALPAAEDLPEPSRRSRETGAPGYSGRKRGDIQFRRVTVQHAGSGAWIHAHLSKGNGDGVADFEPALRTVVDTCSELSHPLDRTVMRSDGELGNVPGFTAFREAHLPFVTRLNRPKLYEDPDVLARLRAATWHIVPDSLSGPRRSAADLGLMTVEPGERTRRPDGSTYEPVTVRVVASIFPNDGAAKRGKTLDGFQVELFATDLPADRWPAAEVVATYFGRTAEENRFAQEDRELGLDRIVSYHLPGQELATLVGLSLWNLRIANGFALDPPPSKRPAQPIRLPVVDERVPQAWPRDPVVASMLARLDWTEILQRWPGWTWDPVSGELRCEDGRVLALTSVRPAEHAAGRTGIIFRRPTSGCEDCPTRDDCLRSDRLKASKHAEIAVPTEIAEGLRARLTLVREHAPMPANVPGKSDTSAARAVTDSLFLPAAARHVDTDVYRGATLRVEVEVPPAPPPRPRLVAADVGNRQRRRKTWSQNLDRYALPDATRVRVEVAGSAALRARLGQQARSAAAANSGHR